jgi:hypothetical protein
MYSTPAQGKIMGDGWQKPISTELLCVHNPSSHVSRILVSYTTKPHIYHRPTYWLIKDSLDLKALIICLDLGKCGDVYIGHMGYTVEECMKENGGRTFNQPGTPHTLALVKLLHYTSSYLGNHRKQLTSELKHSRGLPVLLTS